MNDSQNGQMKAHIRLRTLYGISQLLSTFESVEETFPKMLTNAAESFPLLTVVLIEHWDGKPKTTIWHSADATPEQVGQAISNAKKYYLYLTGDSLAMSTHFKSNVTPTRELFRNADTQKSDQMDQSNCIFLPLIIDNLPPLGAIQFEGASKLDEMDLEFVNAMADLISVALDRSYKTKIEREFREKEARESLTKLYRSQDKIDTLETERELREAFVSLLTHDLRTPLTVILGAAQQILRKSSDSEFTHANALKIVKQVDRVGKMVSDLLDANRIRSGETLPLKREMVELASLIQETLIDLTIIHGDRFVFMGSETVETHIDRNGIRRIIENLSNNAIKYGSPNTPVIITLEQDEKNVFICVQNEGDPISSEDQKSLFKQFRRTEKADKSHNKGWGIGLTLVRGVAEAHGGNVTVKSEPQIGTVFTVTLPKKI